MTEETTEVPPVEPPKEVVGADNTLAQAQKAVADMKVENDRHEALIVREEELKAKELLSGKTNVGIAPLKPPEETDEEYKDRILRGEKDEPKEEKK